MSVVLPEIPLEVAVIVAVPTELALAFPEDVIVATLSEPEIQVTPVSRRWLEPSEKFPVA